MSKANLSKLLLAILILTAGCGRNTDYTSWSAFPVTVAAAAQQCQLDLETIRISFEAGCLVRANNHEKLRQSDKEYCYEQSVAFINSIKAELERGK